MVMKIGTETNQGSRNLKMIMKKYINQPLTTPSPHPTKMKNDAIPRLKIQLASFVLREHRRDKNIWYEDISMER